jgi:hypothetical protein
MKYIAVDKNENDADAAAIATSWRSNTKPMICSTIWPQQIPDNIYNNGKYIGLEKLWRSRAVGQNKMTFSAASDMLHTSLNLHNLHKPHIYQAV